jgi:hypothetical protein
VGEIRIGRNGVGPLHDDVQAAIRFEAGDMGRQDGVVVVC